MPTRSGVPACGGIVPAMEPPTLTVAEWAALVEAVEAATPEHDTPALASAMDKVARHMAPAASTYAERWLGDGTELGDYG